MLHGLAIDLCSALLTLVLAMNHVRPDVLCAWMPLRSALLSFIMKYRPNRSSIDKFRLRNRFARICFAECDIFRPAHDTSHPRSAVPREVCDCWSAPTEGGIGVARNKGYVLRYKKFTSSKKLLHHLKHIEISSNDSGGWSRSKKRCEKPL